MRVAWEALAARARGLTSHLLSEERIRHLERAAGVTELSHQLRETPYGPFLPQPRDVGTGAVETALTRVFAQRMATLAKWAGPENVALGALFLEQDAHNLRTILRGVVGALPSERRLGDALPTPSLDRRALEHLARSESAGAVAAALVAWGHPLGSPLLEEAGRTHVDLFRLEAALDRGLAETASRAARVGGKPMRRFVAESVDTRNVLAALVLAGSRSETDPGELFVEGGERLSREAFARAASTGDAFAAATRLRSATAGTLFASALAEPTSSASAVARRILSARVRRLESERRRRPLSALPVLLFILRARAEAFRLRRALWSAALIGGAAA